VSPLLALQRDQADALRARGLDAVTVNALSGQSTRADASAAPSVRQRSRVEMIRRYAEMTDCRRRFLLRYLRRGGI